MNFFCKKFLIFLMALYASLFTACLFDAEEPEFSLRPDNGMGYFLFPNDPARNDSVSTHLAHGVSMLVHPKAMYELSFDADPDYSNAPTMHLYEVFEKQDPNYARIVKVKKVSGKLIDGRFVYQFSYDGNKMARYALTLERNKKYYEGKISNVRLKGDGAYSDHFSVNLIVVGDAATHIADGSIDELAEKLLGAYREYYTSVVVDTLYVNFANEHPKLGAKYPVEKDWIAGYTSDDVFLSELAGWPGVENALDIVLVYRIDADGVMGYSNLFSGNMGGGLGSSVVIASTVKGADYHDELTIDEIVETAVHETGHFFGLRHTTSSVADMNSSLDFSIFEDGFTDTPYCEDLLNNGLLKTHPLMTTDIKVLPRIRISATGNSGKPNLADCPDASNFMFPASTSVKYQGFSEQQLAALRASLMLFPH